MFKAMVEAHLPNWPKRFQREWHNLQLLEEELLAYLCEGVTNEDLQACLKYQRDWDERTKDDPLRRMPDGSSPVSRGPYHRLSAALAQITHSHSPEHQSKHRQGFADFHRKGQSVIISAPPNSGKASIVNALLGGPLSKFMARVLGARGVSNPWRHFNESSRIGLMEDGVPAAIKAQLNKFCDFMDPCYPIFEAKISCKRSITVKMPHFLVILTERRPSDFVVAGNIEGWREHRGPLPVSRLEHRTTRFSYEGRIPSYLPEPDWNAVYANWDGVVTEDMRKDYLVQSKHLQAGALVYLGYTTIEDARADAKPKIGVFECSNTKDGQAGAGRSGESESGRGKKPRMY
jgi:hypothetical protein